MTLPAGQLKQLKEVVNLRMGHQLRQNNMHENLWRKQQIWHWVIVFHKFRDFFNNGFTWACLKHCGTTPEIKEVLMISVITGISLSKQTKKLGEGTGSWSQDFFRILPRCHFFLLIGSYVLPSISYLLVSLHLLFRELKIYRRVRKSETERLTSNSMNFGNPQTRPDFSPGNPENVCWNSETENNRWWRPSKGSSGWHIILFILNLELLAKNFPNAQLTVEKELSNHSPLSLLIMITHLGFYWVKIQTEVTASASAQKENRHIKKVLKHGCFSSQSKTMGTFLLLIKGIFSQNITRYDLNNRNS